MQDVIEMRKKRRKLKAEKNVFIRLIVIFCWTKRFEWRLKFKYYRKWRDDDETIKFTEYATLK